MSIVRTRLVYVEQPVLGMSVLIDLIRCFHRVAKPPYTWPPIFTYSGLQPRRRKRW